jgi:hypothetical protein
MSLGFSSGVQISNDISSININEGILSGFVNDTSGNPIDGALIRVYFHETYREEYSDSNGYYEVRDIPICYCMKNATCSKIGYKTEWVLISIAENTTYDFELTSINLPPNIPVITGEKNGSATTAYEYTFTSDDPEENDVWYFIEWGDGWKTRWVGPYSSGTSHSQERAWVEGNYTIRCKAKDIYDVESGWAEFDIKISEPRTRTFHWMQFLDMFPVLQRILHLLH